MKKSLIFTAGIFISTAAFAFDAQNYNPITNVNTCIKNEYSISSKFGSYYRTLAKKTVNAYDSTGLLLEEAQYSAKDKLLLKTSFTYDSERNLIEKNTVDAEGKSLEKITYTYSAQELKEIASYSGDTLVEKTIFKKEDDKTDKSLYDANGALVKKTVLIYQGTKLAEEIIYNCDGTLECKNTYSYNDKNKIDSVVKTNADSSVEKIAYHYDAKDNLSEETFYDSEDNIFKRIIFKSTDDGNVSKVSFYDVSQKFGGTANELTLIYEFSYK